MNNARILHDLFKGATEGHSLWPPLRNVCVFFQTFGWNANQYFERYYGADSGLPLLMVANQEGGTVFISETGTKDLARHLFKNYWSNPGFINEIEKEITVEVASLRHLYLSHPYDTLQKLTEDEQKTLLVNVQERVHRLNTRALGTVYFDREFAQALLTELSISQAEELLGEVWERAADPLEGSFDLAQRREVLNARAASLSREQAEHRLAYFFTSYAGTVPRGDVITLVKRRYPEADWDRQQALRALEEESSRHISDKRAYQGWLEGLSPESRRLAEYIQAIVVWRDQRKAALAQSMTIWWRLAEIIFERAGVDKALIPFYTLNELRRGSEYLKGQSEHLQRRLDGFLVYIEPDGAVHTAHASTDELAAELHEYYLKSQGGTKGEVIKGQIGSRGRAEGVARVVLNPLKPGNFQKGDILITGMTRPEFVPLMGQASAVVTDEGGVTCHAAIVSREMGIPCVIGTKVATSQIKDGDRVLVDADKGEVRILAEG